MSHVVCLAILSSMLQTERDRMVSSLVIFQISLPTIGDHVSGSSTINVTDTGLSINPGDKVYSSRYQSCWPSLFHTCGYRNAMSSRSLAVCSSVVCRSSPTLCQRSSNSSRRRLKDFVCCRVVGEPFICQRRRHGGLQHLGPRMTSR